ncbi:MAG: zinc ABC transporter substrate-binding protein [Saprospiraceae bacterium]|nr:zinc ABC transporter substrate-binding protein [Saprospiraceae bacterium]
MKKFLTLVHLLICLVAYGQKPLVVSSASIFADMSKRIGGDHIEVQSIVPIGGDPHKYEATPDDARLLAGASLILINGLTFEGWINEVIDTSGTKARVVLITEGIEAIKSAEHQNAVDPHAWMDAENGLIYLKNIKDALVTMDPGHAQDYEKNYFVYKEELTELHQYIQRRMAEIPPAQRILITSHDAFSYFGNKYGLKINAMMGVSTDADAQTGDMERVIEALTKQKVPAIFIESTINPKMLMQIAHDHNVIIGGSLYADSVGEPGTEGESYLGMMRHNADVIAGALSRQVKTGISLSTGINWSMYAILIAALLLSWVLLILKLKK